MRRFHICIRPVESSKPAFSLDLGVPDEAFGHLNDTLDEKTLAKWVNPLVRWKTSYACIVSRVIELEEVPE